MMSLKRSIDNLADIDEDKHGIELHFGMEELSPMKTARSGIPYYHGQATMELVDFIWWGSTRPHSRKSQKS